MRVIKRLALRSFEWVTESNSPKGAVYNSLGQRPISINLSLDLFLYFSYCCMYAKNNYRR